MKIKFALYLITLFFSISMNCKANSDPCSSVSTLCTPKPWTTPPVCGCSASATIPKNHCYLNPIGHKLVICKPNQWYYCDADAWIQKQGGKQFICQS